MSERIRLPKLLAAANGAPCMNCGAQDGTVVAAHSNSSAHGKGMGQKAHDIFVAYLCVRCHDWYDYRTSGMDPTGVYFPEERQAMWQKAHGRTFVYAFAQGVLREA